MVLYFQLDLHPVVALCLIPPPALPLLPYTHTHSLTLPLSLSLALQEISLDSFLPPVEEANEYMAAAASLDISDRNEAYCERTPGIFVCSIQP